MLARAVKVSALAVPLLGSAALALLRPSNSRKHVAMKSYKVSDTCKLVLKVGDLTEFQGDAIVNAANEQMLGGGGVDGAIHRAAGPKLEQACREHPVVERTWQGTVRCPTGEARLTEGFNLPSKYVIHTVGPVYQNAEVSAPLLQAAHRGSLEIANLPDHEIRHIAFPAISCGVYGYPLDEAAKVAIETCVRHCGSLASITFVFFSEATAKPFMDYAASLLDSEAEAAGDTERD